jgi:hypothetical protein
MEIDLSIFITYDLIFSYCTGNAGKIQGVFSRNIVIAGERTAGPQFVKKVPSGLFRQAAFRIAKSNFGRVRPLERRYRNDIHNKFRESGPSQIS